MFSIWVWSADTPGTSFAGDPNSKLSDLVTGTAHKPYVQRALLPLLTRTVLAALPSDWQTSLRENLIRIPKVRKEMSRLGWEVNFLPEYIVVLLFAYVSLLCIPVVLRRLWKLAYETDDALTNLVPILVLFLLVPLFSTGPHYVYDFPAMLFFSMGFVFVLERRWLYFYPVFVIGCLNKETMIFLMPFYIILFWRKEPGQKLLLNAVAQFGLFAIVKWIIDFSFSQNPGESLEFHLYANLHTVLLGYSWSTLLGVLFAGGLVFYDFPNKPQPLRHSVFLILVFGGLIFCFGLVGELRAAYEVLPLTIFLMFHTIFFSLFRLPFRVMPLPESANQ